MSFCQVESCVASMGAAADAHASGGENQVGGSLSMRSRSFYPRMYTSSSSDHSHT